MVRTYIPHAGILNRPPLYYDSELIINSFNPNADKNQQQWKR